MAELADAPDSGSGGRKPVGVQIPPSALPFFPIGFLRRSAGPTPHRDDRYTWPDCKAPLWIAGSPAYEHTSLSRESHRISLTGPDLPLVQRVWASRLLPTMRLEKAVSNKPSPRSARSSDLDAWLPSTFGPLWQAGRL